MPSEGMRGAWTCQASGSLSCLQLTMLEVLIVKDNKLTNLRKVESLPNLRVIDASNNNITSLH